MGVRLGFILEDRNGAIISFFLFSAENICWANLFLPSNGRGDASVCSGCHCWLAHSNINKSLLGELRE